MQQADVPNGNKFMLQINLEKSKISGSKRFISVQSISKLASKIDNEFQCDKDDGNGVVMLKLVDMTNHKVKTIKITTYVQGRETVEKVKERLMDIDKVTEIPEQEKYRVVIENCQSSNVDKRAFSMRYKGTIQDCYGCMRIFFDDVIKKIQDKDIVFIGEKISKATHRVIIYKSGSLENYKKIKSKSFSITLPNYSSKEITDVIREEIQCKKQK